jgi:hypothetical protein
MAITNEELTVTPFIEVDAKDGRIGKRPLQVAGALTLPAADVVSLWAQFSITITEVRTISSDGIIKPAISG